MNRLVLATAAVALLAACASGPSATSTLPSGGAAYSVISAPPVAEQAGEYRIGPLDSISIAVFQEPELSVNGAQVDAAGNIALPLLGRIPAAGKTASELSGLIAEQLGAKYLEKPQVTVSVAGSVSQRVVVQGEVNQAGVYEVKGRTTLLEALALARGETRVARLQEVVVFREVNGQRMGAVFDVAAIRRGQAEDPIVLGNDVVVVGLSHAKSIWRDVRESAGIVSVFRPF